ncbi:hypothetical protein LguiA_003378 [Lonicera macranthoides]
MYESSMANFGALSSSAFSSLSSSFGSKKSSSSSFGSQLVFGQSTNETSNPFPPKPIGSIAPFASQIETSIFGGTSIGVLGSNQSSSPLAATPVFGASPSPYFRSSIFGASLTLATDTSSSLFRSSAFRQNPTFRGFGSFITQSSPLGSNFQSQLVFANSLFGFITPFQASSLSAFGSSITSSCVSSASPAFGVTGAPAFSATSTSAFGSTATPAFGSTGSGFGVYPVPHFLDQAL